MNFVGCSCVVISALDKKYNKKVMSRVRTKDEKRTHTSAASSDRLDCYTKYVYCSCQSVLCINVNCERHQRSNLAEYRQNKGFTSGKLKTKAHTTRISQFKKYWDVCAAVVCLALIVQYLPDCVETAPISSRNLPHRLFKRADMSLSSLNPCGSMKFLNRSTDPGAEIQLFSDVMLYTSDAIHYAQTLLENYCQKYLGISWDEAAPRYTYMKRGQWHDFKEEEKIDLADYYYRLQVFAAAIEVFIKRDTIDEHFYDDFDDLKSRVNSVTCKLLALMDHKGVVVKKQFQESDIPMDGPNDDGSPCIYETDKRDRDPLLLRDLIINLNRVKNIETIIVYPDSATH